MATLGTFTAGQVLTAAELNQLNNFTALFLEASQSIPDTTDTNATFGAGSETADVSGWHSTSTNNDRITPTVAGIYLVGGLARFNYNSATSKSFFVGLVKNDAVAPFADQTLQGTYFPGCVSTGIVALNGTTDYVTLRLWHNVGVNVNSFRRSLYCILLRAT